MRWAGSVLTCLVAVLVLTMTAFPWRAEAQRREQGNKAKVELPAAVAKAVRDNVPNAEIDTLEAAEEAGVKLYDIEFKAGKGER